MNQTIEQLLGHYSVREFEDKPLSEEQIKLLVQSAQAASTSNFVQAYSIIGVSDKSIRRELSKIASNMGYVEKTGQFFCFLLQI
ncbi:putative NADPH-dependent flavin reductase and oxygen insensitive nitroreductase [Listeria fleischmannii FSL S10-1203]|uniref:Putative NADPH-dependent flavin reductase and oxygen insensitive nitroreductase n=1 Tax=Listeria fleischmannii FSL S10-1203 TaxID=1265822 RepID=W7DZJ2_9LIST|nr:putative NADPH-dependent flavin reductase and oxygen insensitive nitroreductase [Listeria fleischmannii FSL S10-1203]